MAVNKAACESAVTGVTTGGTLTAHLYTNAHIPSFEDEDDASDYEEADFPGYVPIDMSSWGTLSSAPGSAYRDHLLVWNPGEGASGYVLGIYVTNPDGELMFAVAFDAPVAIVEGISLTKTIRLRAKDPEAE